MKKYFYLFVPLIFILLVGFLMPYTRIARRGVDKISYSIDNFVSRLQNAENYPVEKLSDRLTELKIVVKSEALAEGEVKANDDLKVHYRGWLASDGTIFDQSFDNLPDGFSFVQGSGVIQGWSQGVLGMKLGEVRRLYIPSNLAYGEVAQGSIPANSDLIFDVELIGINLEN